MTTPHTAALSSWGSPEKSPPRSGRTQMKGPLSQRRPPPRLARLDARPGRRKHLGRAAPVLWVERRAQSQHHAQIVRRKQTRHEVDLLHADAVLTGDATATVDALFEDLVTSCQHALGLVGIALVEEQDRMN